MNISQEVLAAGLLILCGAIGWLLIRIDRLSDRILILETTIRLIGLNSAKAMHSPHTPGLDVLLEKYVDRHYELTSTEWDALMQECEMRMDDKNEPHGYRLNAALLAAICHHKLGHPPARVKRVRMETE